jgi:hypothetical protein
MFKALHKHGGRTFVTLFARSLYGRCNWINPIKVTVDAQGNQQAQRHREIRDCNDGDAQLLGQIRRKRELSDQ